MFAGIAVLAVAFVLACVAIVVDGLRDRLAPVELGVVFASYVEPSGLPSPRLKARLDRAFDVYQRGLVRTLFVSGEIEPRGLDEAVAMRTYLVGRGIPADRVVADSKGRNSWLTACDARAFMDSHGMKSAMVITQYFHITRCRLAMSRWGVRGVGSAHARFWEMRDLYSLAREVVALVKYALRRD